ncbi:MAG: hypothetical protein IH991_25760, partial [Planctomycetes bacterium]|nr:hypothetical protein [Planctomycetota bacterium]
MSSDSESTDPSQPTKPDDDPTQPYPGQDDPTLAHPGQPVDAGDNDSLRLARQIEDLPFPFGEAVRLRLLAHWPLSRIAEHLGHSTKYVGSLLISGVQMLERALAVKAGGAANRLARRRARWLLQRVDDLFIL